MFGESWRTRTIERDELPLLSPNPASWRLRMLPHWIELNPTDLIQGVTVLSFAVLLLLFNLFSAAGRA
jgi:hypothetical protein